MGSGGSFVMEYFSYMTSRKSLEMQDLSVSSFTSVTWGFSTESICSPDFYLLPCLHRHQTDTKESDWKCLPRRSDPNVAAT